MTKMPPSAGSLGDLFDLQAQVATSVGGVIEPTLQAAETAGSANPPTLAAYDACLRVSVSWLKNKRGPIEQMTS